MVLRTTSGFFRDMLTLPKAVSPKVAAQQSDSIALDETSEVLGPLFRMISGLKYGNLTSSEKFLSILRAAYKYDMEGAVETLRRFTALPDFADQPLKMYALAAQYGWEKEAKAASKCTLAVSIHQEEHDAVLKTIPPEYLLRLLKLHRDRRDQFERSTIETSGSAVKCFGMTSCHHCSQSWSANGPMVALAYAMVRSLDRRADGEVLLKNGWKSWQDKNLCDTSGCSGRAAKKWEDKIQSWVNSCVASLPCSI